MNMVTMYFLFTSAFYFLMCSLRLGFILKFNNTVTGETMACNHNPDEPERYQAWHEWAEKRSKKHKQVKCPKCGKLKWERKMSLEKLLKMKVKGENSVTKKEVEFSPDFRIAVQNITEKGVHIIVHANGHNSDTLDFLVKGNKLIQL